MCYLTRQYSHNELYNTYKDNFSSLYLAQRRRNIELERERNRLQLEFERERNVLQLELERERLHMQIRIEEEQKEKVRQRHRQEMDDEAAHAAMTHAHTTDERVKAYRAALHTDPRIAKLQILDMGHPLEVANVFVRVRLHRESKVGYDLPLSLAEAQNQSDPNALLLASRRHLEESISAALDPDEAIRQYRHCVFVGDPGAGKTTLLKYLTLNAADGQWAGLPDLPIHVELNAFARSGYYDLLDFVASYWDERYGFPKSEARAHLETVLQTGRALLLLDALDEAIIGTTKEAADASYQQIAEAITRIATRYPGAPMVVSARKAGYYLHARLIGFTELEVLDFRAEDIAQFIDNWFAYSPRTYQQTSADDLKECLARNPRLHTLAANPLLLSLIVIVYGDQLDLPDCRAELYRQCVDVLLQKWDSSRNIRRRREFRPEHKRQLLEEIAWHFHIRRQRYLQELELMEVIAGFLSSINQTTEQAMSVLEEIAAENGLLKEQAHHWYGFLHLSLQEYFTAVYISDHSQCDDLLTHIGDPWWEEVLLLYAGHIPDASPLLQKLIGEDLSTPRPDDLFYTDLLLAGRCLAARPIVRTPSLRNTIVERIFDELQHTTYVLGAEHIANVLAEIGGQEISTHLLALLRDQQLEEGVRREIAGAIGELGNKSMVPELLALLHDQQLEEGVRREMARAIGKRGDKSVVPDLMALLHDQQLEEGVRRQLAYAIGGLGDKSVVPILVTLLREQRLEEWIRWAIATAIGKLGDKSVVPNLLALLRNQQLEIHLRGGIARAIGYLGNESIVSELMALLHDQQLEEEVHWEIVSAIEELGDRGVVSELLALLRDQQLDQDVKPRIAMAIGALGDQSVVPYLLALLHDQQLEEEVLREIVIAIGNLGDKSVVSDLVALLCDQQPKGNAHWRIAKTIGNLGDKSVVPKLLALLGNHQIGEEVRSAMAIAIGTLGGDITVIESLIPYLNAPDIREYVYSALWEISRRTRVRIVATAEGSVRVVSF